MQSIQFSDMNTLRLNSLKNLLLPFVSLIIYLCDLLCFVQKKQLDETQEKIKQQIQEREMKLWELKEAVGSQKVSF